MKVKSITLAEKMRVMHAAGMSIGEIAEACGVYRNRVKRTVDDEYRDRVNKRTREKQKAARRARGLRKAGFQPHQVEADWPVYDGGEAWVEDRTIARSPSGPRYNKPENRPEKPAPITSFNFEPACVAAVRKHFAGDATALGDYLRSIGR